MKDVTNEEWEVLRRHERVAYAVIFAAFVIVCATIFYMHGLSVLSAFYIVGAALVGIVACNVVLDLLYADVMGWRKWWWFYVADDE